MIGRCYLLAETHMAQVSTQYRDEAFESSGSPLILLVPVVAVIAGLAIYYWHSREPAAVDRSEGLVHQLCAAHGLPRASRQLILKMGRAAEITQPASMFLSIDHFENAVQKASRRIRYGNSDKKQLGLIRRRVFTT